jgi:hypothetical protein
MMTVAGANASKKAQRFDIRDSAIKYVMCQLRQLFLRIN